MQGVYLKAKGADSLLGQLGYVLDERPAEKPLDVASVPPVTQAQANGVKAPAEEDHSDVPTGEVCQKARHVCKVAARPFGPILNPKESC